MSKLPIEYLRHILDETKFIINQSQNLEEDDFYNNPVLTRAFIRSLEIIGEATKNIPKEFTSKYPDIEWKYMARIRDRLIHHYFGVDYFIIWDIVITEIPKLHDRVIEIIAENNCAGNHSY